MKKLAFLIPAEAQGKRLDQFLADELPGALQTSVSKSRIRTLILAGAVYLNGKRVRIASKPLIARARLEIYIDPTKWARTEAQGLKEFHMTEQNVVYEDDSIIVVNKPAGLPTQPTVDEARANLFASVKSYLAQKQGPAVYVGLHHRLDRDTSGLVLFTKKKEANPGIADAFKNHTIHKTYLAISVNPPRPPITSEWSVQNFLGRDTASPKKRARFRSVRSGGDPAHTDFKILEYLNGALLIEACPRTGRTHQIRVHLGEAKMSIFGDELYGYQGQGPEKPSRIFLHALRLEFPHPITSQPMRIESAIPPDFNAYLEKLR